MTKTGLSGNCLKIIAAIFMLTDHIGYILFPDMTILRIIGRLAFPVFAFMIAEGCRHTSNKLRYFLTIFLSGVIFQSVYYIASGDMYMNIFITFSLSILLIYALQYFFVFPRKLSAIAGVLIAVATIYALNNFLTIDYGFFGCIAPAFAILFSKKECEPMCRVATFSIGILFLSVAVGTLQYYSLLSIPLLMLYNGKRGKWNMKYFFYIFYPLHLALLYGIQLYIA